MGKRFWSGFGIGIAAALLALVIGFNGYHFAMDQIINRASKTVESDLENADTNSEKDGLSGVSVLGVMSKINLLQRYIDTYYLNDINEDALKDGIYKGYIKSLEDPYSVYYTENEYKSLQESTDGTYCGIGARVTQDMDTGIISIVTPFKGSPAEEAGILPGDIVYSVAGEPVTGEDLSEVVAKMKGKEGTSVDLVLIRGDQEKQATCIRRKIEIPTVEYEMMENQIGYIQVSEFDGVTAQQFRLAVDELEKQGQKGMVIDLRNNGGGRLDAVVDMLDRMLPEGIVVSTKDKNGEGETYTSSNKESFSKPLEVLINGNSASASEVFAGAIQDYQAGKLVGTTSFGKGIVQSIFALNDGTAIKLTTSEYFTPQGRNIHGKGLTPDLAVDLEEQLKRKVVIDKKDDNQLQAAVADLLKQTQNSAVGETQ